MNLIGHTLREETGATEETALDWNPQGYRRRGWPKITWRRTIEEEIRSTRRSWKEVKRIAGDRNGWKLVMDALCSTRSKKDLITMMMMMMMMMSVLFECFENWSACLSDKSIITMQLCMEHWWNVAVRG